MVYDDQLDQELFTAGQCVPPGQYRRIDSGMIIYLDSEDVLPASLDGRVAAYMQVQDFHRTVSAATHREIRIRDSREMDAESKGLAGR